jgi:hypothetical protein
MSFRYSVSGTRLGSCAEENARLGAVKQGQRPEFGSSAITLAQIDLAEGHPVDAQARLQTMARILEEENSTFAISYYNYIASAQLAQKHAVQAEKTLAHARSLLTDSNQSGFDGYYLAITETRAAVALHPQVLTCARVMHLADY